LLPEECSAWKWLLDFLEQGKWDQTDNSVQWPATTLDILKLPFVYKGELLRLYFRDYRQTSIRENGNEFSHPPFGPTNYTYSFHLTRILTRYEEVLYNQIPLDERINVPPAM